MAELTIETPAEMQKATRRRVALAVCMCAFVGGPALAFGFGIIAYVPSNHSTAAALIAGGGAWAGLVAFAWFGSRGQLDFRLTVAGGTLSVDRGGRRFSVPAGDILLIESSRHATRLNALLARVASDATPSTIGWVRVTSAAGGRKVLLPPGRVDSAGEQLATVCPNALWVDSDDLLHPPVSHAFSAAGLNVLARRRRSQAVSMFAAGGGTILAGVLAAIGLFDTTSYEIRAIIVTPILCLLGGAFLFWGVRTWREAADLLG